jgi:sulfatase maturation enzyme AslB (radical SAM superfamily)
MSFETAKKAIDYLFDNRLNDNFYFSEQTSAGIIFEFIGGEPLLEIDLIE